MQDVDGRDKPGHDGKTVKSALNPVIPGRRPPAQSAAADGEPGIQR
jgi:hypothetical protein